MYNSSDASQGPKLIIAGPGTGKTTTLVSEIEKYLINSQHKDQGLIVSTFTRKAAEELKVRLFSRINSDILSNKKLIIGTIHSVCLEILKSHPSGNFSDFEIISEDELPSYIYSNLIKLGFDKSRIGTNQQVWDFCTEVAGIYGLITDQRIGVTSLDFADNPQLGEICVSYKIYKLLLEKDSKFDFATAQAALLEQLSQDDSWKESINNAFGRIFVDEYQDTNALQNELLIELAGPSRNITVVGDDDQSIYRFRGADVSNLLDFATNVSKDSQEIQTEKLENNYRSTTNLVNFIDKFIRQSGFPRHEKNFISARSVVGHKPILKSFINARLEAVYIADLILYLKENEKIQSFSDIAVLFRSAKFQSKDLQQVFREKNIPFELVGVGDFFEAEVMREFLAILAYIIDRGVDSLITFNDNISEIDTNLLTIYKQNAYFEKLLAVKDLISNYKSNTALIYDLFLASNFLERHANWENNLGKITELVLNFDQNSRGFDVYSLWSYLYYLKANRKIDFDYLSTTNTVKIMTIHRSKGLEFHTVFLPNQILRAPSEGIQDRFRKISGLPLEGEADENRLFYVGATRAKDFLVVTHPLESGSGKKLFSPSKQFALAAAQDSLIEEEIYIDEINPSLHNPDKDFNKSRILSYNQIRTYETCPKLYMYTNVWKLQTVRTGGMQYGINVHRLLQIINDQIRTGLDPDLIDVSSLVREYWKKNWALSPSQNDKFMNSAEKQIQKFKDFFQSQNPNWQVFGIEEEFNVVVNGHLITGRFDAIYYDGENYLIVDYKTGDPRDYSGQMNFYSVCFEKKYGMNNVRTLLYYLNAAEIDEVQWNDEIRTNQISRISEIGEKINRAEYSATPGEYCSDCAFNLICDDKLVKNGILKFRQY